MIFNNDTIVIIPSYEPPLSFIDYVRELSAAGAGILVINDGSSEKYSDIYRSLAEIDSCTVIGYSENKGKGYALKEAFRYCQSNYSTNYTFVTADCDGQHLVSDVASVAKTAANHREKLVLGARDFSSPNVPTRSRAGNLQTRRMFRLLYRISLTDTQTGLRAFSYQLLERLIKINGTRFEYEMNMLIVLHKADVDIVEVPISTIYNEKSDDVEKLSHFRTFKDSFRVVSTLFKNLGWYFTSSALSAILDVLLFFILANYVFTDQGLAINMLLATVISRVGSSLVNFTFNYKLVFGGKSKLSIFKYYCLFLIQLAISYGFASAWNSVFIGLAYANLLTALCKGLCDLLIALLSYQVQSHWVFADEKKSKLRFYGWFLRFCRFFYNVFSKKYRCFVIPDDDAPNVYLCRHLNMHGPIKICQSMSFDLHLYILHNFMTVKDCYKQYSTYTFTERRGKTGVARFFAKIAAAFAALGVVPLVRSIKPIPVWRGGSDSMITYRKSMEYLAKGENIIIFPDIDYTAGQDACSDIYTGFLYLDKLYYRKFKKHLNFVVLNVDDEKKAIYESGRVGFSEGSDFYAEMPQVAERLHSLLMHRNV